MARRHAGLMLLWLFGVAWAIPAATTGAGRLFAAELAATARPRQAANSIVMTNKSGSTIRDYPFQFGRPFVRDAIPAGQCPQILVTGNAVGRAEPAPSQADVKNRYPDGSVEFAVMATVVPTLPDGRAVTLTFRPGPCGNAPLSKAQMLGSSFNFNTVLSVTGVGAGAIAQTVSARTMLANGDYKLWTAGPVAQTVILADDTATRKYDIGFGDGYHPLRPRFYATFWPATHQVFVRAVGENDNTAELEDLSYKLSISAGQTSPSVVYSGDLSGAPKQHWALTAWSRSFWLGGTPNPQVNIDNNLAYLESTRFIPNYDPSISVPASAVAAQYARWTGLPHDIYDGAWNRGLWQSGMPVSGARAELAPYPEWSVLWLYTGDWRMRQVALGLADLAGAFPGNLREGVAGKRLSRADAVGSSTGLGHTMSLTDRASLVSSLLRYSSTCTGVGAPFQHCKGDDAVAIVGPYKNQPWSFDGSHQPSPFYPQYILTGDPWYLNEMYLWAGFSAALYNGADTDSASGRGPTGAEGGINDALRGAAWVLRNRAETAFAAPDADPEKAYFTYLTNDALARWEGSFGISGTAYDGQAVKLWGAKTGVLNSTNGGPLSGKLPPLGNWESAGNPNGKDATIVNNEKSQVFRPGAVGTFTAPWNHWYLHYALGRAEELGFAVDPIRKMTDQYVITMINDSGYPDLLAAYELPVESNCTNTAPPYSASKPGCTAPPGGFLPSWAAIGAALYPGFLTGAGYPASGNSGYGALPQYFRRQLTQTGQADGYPLWAMSGLAMAVDHGDAGAERAWRWFVPNVYRAVTPGAIPADPKWAIVPRTDTNPLPAQPTATPLSAGVT
jgi:hypothetical protein